MLLPCQISFLLRELFDQSPLADAKALLQLLTRWGLHGSAQLRVPRPFNLSLVTEAYRIRSGSLVDAVPRWGQQCCTRQLQTCSSVPNLLRSSPGLCNEIVPHIRLRPRCKQQIDRTPWQSG